MVMVPVVGVSNLVKYMKDNIIGGHLLILLIKLFAFRLALSLILAPSAVAVSELHSFYVSVIFPAYDNLELI